MNCVKCGYELIDDWEICPKCGQKIKEHQLIDGENYNITNRSEADIYLVAFLIASTIGVFIPLVNVVALMIIIAGHLKYNSNKILKVLFYYYILICFIWLVYALINQILPGILSCFCVAMLF